MKRKRIKSSWTDYFNFSSRERNGAFLLSCILLLQICILYYQQNHIRFVPQPDEKIISALRESINSKPLKDLDSEKSSGKIENKITYFNFDPNKSDDSSFHKLGLSEKQTRVINNYLSHGGKFRIKNDFKKIYCISQLEYNNLKPYILLPEITTFEKTVYLKPQKRIISIDLEKTDSIALMDLRGIGAVFASRIVRYRERLGGFYSMDQLKEVFGITDSLYYSLIPSLTLKNTTPFRYIHLNTDSFEILASHPYIKGKIAGLICKYRKQHKIINSIEEVKQLPLITEEIFLKLAPYLVVD